MYMLIVITILMNHNTIQIKKPTKVRPHVQGSRGLYFREPMTSMTMLYLLGMTRTEGN